MVYWKKRLLYEIEKRGYYWNNINCNIKKFVNSNAIYTTHKLNKFKKPIHTQIIPYSQIKRVEMDISYL